MIKAHQFLAAFLLFFVLVLPNAGQSQVASTMTIGAVKSMLEDTLKELQATIQSASSEIKGVGNSLQANAQNVIKDIDDSFDGNLDMTFDRMDETQRNLFRDAQALAEELKRASITLVQASGSEARRALADADILAYNTSYSLPCRSQIPRFVYSLPETIRAQQRSVITIKGNFLDVGEEPVFRLGDAQLKVLSRNANEIKVQVPAEAVDAVTKVEDIALRTKLSYRKKTLLLYLYCYDREDEMDNDSLVSVTLLPQRKVDVTGWIQPTVISREDRTVTHNVDLGKPGACDANLDVSRQVCSPDDWRVKGVSSFRIVSKNCGSNAGPPQISGDRCVLVPGNNSGCGYDRVLGQKVNCKGRGWLHWEMLVDEYRELRTEKTKFDFAQTGDEKFSFTFRYPESAQTMNQPQWSYGATVTIKEGSIVKQYEVSQANENVGPVGARLVDGTLSINIAE